MNEGKLQEQESMWDIYHHGNLPYGRYHPHNHPLEKINDAPCLDHGQILQKHRTIIITCKGVVRRLLLVSNQWEEKELKKRE